MFKLKKFIGGSRINVPEILEIPISVSIDIKYGCIYFCSNYGIEKSATNSTGSDSFPIVALENIGADDRKSSLKCFMLTSEMIFEADLTGNASGAYKGRHVSLGTDSDGIISNVLIEDGNDAIIYDNTDADKNKVYVQILRERLTN